MYIIICQPFAIRWIGYYNTLTHRCFEIGYISSFQLYVSAKSRRFYVLCSYLDGFCRQVVAIYFVSEITFFTIVIEYLLEEVGIEIVPFLESELFTEYPRRYIECYQSRLYEQSTRTAANASLIGALVCTER